MKKSMEYITRTVVITEQAVYKNGMRLFCADPPASALPPTQASSAAPPARATSTHLTASGATPGASPDFWPALYRHFNWQYPKFFKMDNLSKLGWAAAEVLLEGWTHDYKPQDIAVVLSNANSSLDTDYRYTATTKDIPSPAVFVYTLPNIVIGEICIRHRIKGENAFFLSQQFDARLLANYVTMLFAQDVARACITGWVELLGGSFKAAFFLIEKKALTGALAFTPENMNDSFNNSTH